MVFLGDSKKLKFLNLVCYCLLLSACNIVEKDEKFIRGFTQNGFENFKIGDGTQNLKEVEDSRIGDCFIAKDTKNDDVEFQIINNKIAIISSMDSMRASYNGIKIGDLERKIYEKYNKKDLDKRRNPYGDSKKDYSLIDWSNNTKKLGTRYDIENGYIVGIKVGDNNLTLMEGCA
ncbi:MULTISPECIES: hypothetical protein [unclassified Acinetobacter]|uniref:hypothetical protein n=1 Tax=unclassified Acinetobacter TaxID=196816 RepID=UPI0024489BAC|nr:MULTISPECIES: hypothetical protein [unclassified Acinetobacter]MDH0032492.1 hypothetical protein [Acinetobacter sp. GD04021]MDH0888083.1 hypothetical protein [Acinetobacter sp. GD03873]MDH1084367.1 hypothetical protein [Acinetobacter sp. GD03983]MDH2191402.1 hypothetical protein [Acinetobacter sp. GD03645]MDH2204937.1 hypothetical protein [Acinetobacter sp. GD03647]